MITERQKILLSLYWSDSITDDERLELEQALASDPHLRDALDGLRLAFARINLEGKLEKFQKQRIQHIRLFKGLLVICTMVAAACFIYPIVNPSLPPQYNPSETQIDTRQTLPNPTTEIKELDKNSKQFDEKRFADSSETLLKKIEIDKTPILLETSPNTSSQAKKGVPVDTTFASLHHATRDTLNSTPNIRGGDMAGNRRKSAWIKSDSAVGGNMYFFNDATRRAKVWLYSWKQTFIACPSGFHLPSATEWENLLNENGGFIDAENKPTGENIQNTYSKLLEMGLDIPLSGISEGDSNILMQGIAAYYWSSTPSPTNSQKAYTYGFIKEKNTVLVYKFTSNKNNLYSCFCVKNQ